MSCMSQVLLVVPSEPSLRVIYRFRELGNLRQELNLIRATVLTSRHSLEEPHRRFARGLIARVERHPVRRAKGFTVPPGAGRACDESRAGRLYPTAPRDCLTEDSRLKS